LLLFEKRLYFYFQIYVRRRKAAEIEEAHRQ